MTKKKTLGELSASKLAHMVNKDGSGKGSNCLTTVQKGLDIIMVPKKSHGPCDFCSDSKGDKVTMVRGELGMRQVRFCKKCMGEWAEYFFGYS